ncbi:MAG: DUF302 domain-containing protein [Methyloprofundus sp.]|nr:DUF302 domain-containing protein [Methyloprofundus sp.]MDT8424555.1 DUF302 domain-containing protein [Methyloprofundus sp.]
MYYLVESKKSFAQAVTDLDLAVKSHQFGVLHVHDLGATLRSKGIDFTEQCKVFEVCNPQQAAKVLALDIRLNMALPCRISVFSENGLIKIGLIKPAAMLADLSDNAELAVIAKEVEQQLISMVNEAQ